MSTLRDDLEDIDLSPLHRLLSESYRSLTYRSLVRAPNVPTLREDLEQNSPLDLDPLVGLHRPSLDLPLASEGQNNLGEREQDSQVEPPSPESPRASEEEYSPWASEEEFGEIEECSARPHEELEEYSPWASEEEFGEIEESSLELPWAPEEESGEIKQCSARPLEELEEGKWKGDLYHSICGGNWRDAKEILDQNLDALTAQIAYDGRTALHVAAMFGNVCVVEKLLNLLPPESILIPDHMGATALVVACWFGGSTEVAKCLVNKNKDILVTPDKRGDLPVTMAFRSGYEELGRYLYPLTPLQCLTGRRGSRLVFFCLRAQCYDIVLNLLQYCEELLLVPFGARETPIHEIAALNTAILSPSELVFWKRWIYNYINIHSTIAINNVSLDIPHEDRNQGDKAELAKPGIGLLRRLINIIDNFVGVKELQELKLLHLQAHELLRLVCKKAREAFEKDINIIDKALCVAAKEGNVDFVFRVIKEIPEILPRLSILRCFHVALDHRQHRVFNLIHGLRFKKALLTSKTSDGNIMMHKAAQLANRHILNRIYAPTQMQRELQWFKEVESLTPPRFRLIRDKNGITAAESFKETHKNLMKGGEKWIKATASSCLVVGALIVTIMFTAAFTVPGGNDQYIGYPLFIQQQFFKVFIFSTILSLLTSSTSVLMFLAILTSKFLEEEFLKSLPRNLILGLSFLFLSIVSMIIAFLSAIRLMLKHSNYSWGLLPVIILASVPVSLFVRSQFPLLLHTYVSTYGNLFDRKVEPWP